MLLSGQPDMSRSSSGRLGYVCSVCSSFCVPARSAGLVHLLITIFCVRILYFVSSEQLHSLHPVCDLIE